jgi:predicted RNA-binding protein
MVFLIKIIAVDLFGDQQIAKGVITTTVMELYQTVIQIQIKRAIGE